MQAVILAAGKSTRTYPLTLTRPKAMLKVANRPVLQHNLEGLRGFIDEAIVVVGYRKEMIKEHFGDRFMGIRMTYVEQKQQMGTGHALLAAEGHAKGRFMVMGGDDVFQREGIKRLLDHDYSLLAERVGDPSRFGVWMVEDGRVRGFAEKPGKFVSDIANCGLYVLDSGIFGEIRKLRKTERSEYELNEAVNSFAGKEEVRCVISADGWFPVGYPWDLLDVNRKLLERMGKPRVSGEVEPGATLKGKVSVGKGTVIRSGAYIEGPAAIGENCSIGPNCYIRPHTSIGNDCRIGNAVEVKNCVIMDSTRIGHLSYLGDSVLGFDINIGGGSIIANLRHDKGNVKSCVGGRLIDTGRRKLGTIIGDGSKTGVNTTIYPGRKIWPGKFTAPGEIVKKDLE
jgi:UDP-N-acetylglucosamine diphosphorylase/glucosamine-1-phosphate N-acetyltransferase